MRLAFLRVSIHSPGGNNGLTAYPLGFHSSVTVFAYGGDERNELPVSVLDAPLHGIHRRTASKIDFVARVPQIGYCHRLRPLAAAHVSNQFPKLLLAKQSLISCWSVGEA
jgi:hypothetical protein